VLRALLIVAFMGLGSGVLAQALGTEPAPPANPLSRLPLIGRFFGEPEKDADAATGVVAPQYLLEVDAPSPLDRQIRESTLLGRWRQRADYDSSQLPLFVARAPEEVEGLLAAEGYFSPQIRVLEIKGGARVEVIPGPRTLVDVVKLNFSGEVAGPEFDELRARLAREWLLSEGQAFRSPDWERAKREVLSALRDAGFLRARIDDSEALVDVDRRTASLSLDIESAAPLRFGEVVINGLERYPEVTVEGLKTFKQGDPYSVRQIVQLQTRLNGSGFFTSVNVRPDTAALTRNPELQEVPIRVDVVERQSKRIALGGGYDTDAGFNVAAAFENRNVGGLGIQSLTGVTLEVERQVAYSNWDWPPDLEGWRWQVGARAEHRNIQNELVDAASLVLARAHRMGDNEFTYSIQYQHEQQNVVYSATDEQNYINTAAVFGWAWTRRSLDSPLVPNSGYIFTLQTSAASQAVASTQSFARVYTLGYWLIPLEDERRHQFGRMVLRGELGVVAASSSQGIPSANLFRTGGSKSIRGYTSQSIGVAEGQATLGGRYLWTASTEYQHLINRDWAAAVFTDLGTATNSLDALRPYVGYGVGARWRTPVGPLNIDLARGATLEQWRFYVSIGVVF
jgi:translocation and assembly module TamA